MKKILVLLLVSFMIVSCGADANKKPTDQAEQTEQEQSKLKIAKRAEYKSGIIEYKTSGFSTGEQTLYFDDFGFRNAIIQKIKVGETVVENHIIIEEDWTYKINKTEKRYFKEKNTDSKTYRELYEKYKNNEEATAEMYKRAGGHLIGNEKFLDRDCQVWEMTPQNSKNWVWKGVILKSLMSSPFGELTFEATNIKLNVKIPDSVFTVPKNVNFIVVTPPKKKDGL